MTEVDSRPLDQHQTQPVWFGEVVPGATLVRKFLVRNSTPLPLPYSWQFSVPEAAIAEGAADWVGFSIGSPSGMLPASTDAEFEITFQPDQLRR